MEEGEWLVGGSSTGLPPTNSLGYMIAQLHDTLHLNRSPTRCCYSTCSHTDSKSLCRAYHQRSASRGPARLARTTYVWKCMHVYTQDLYMLPCPCATRVPPVFHAITGSIIQTLFLNQRLRQRLTLHYFRWSFKPELMNRTIAGSRRPPTSS